MQKRLRYAAFTTQVGRITGRDAFLCVLPVALARRRGAQWKQKKQKAKEAPDRIHDISFGNRHRAEAVCSTVAVNYVLLRLLHSNKIRISR